MQLLDQVKQEDGSYIVRIWRDEVAPDAIDTYNWVAYNAKMPQSKADYEASQVTEAQRLSALQIPAVADPTVVTQDTKAIADQVAAVAANTPSVDTSAPDTTSQTPPNTVESA